MSSFDEYTKKKKKKELDASDVAKRNSTFRGYTSELLGADLAPLKTTTSVADVAPVKTSNKEEKKWYDGWFKKSEGNFGQATLASGTDLAENAGTGVIGMGEKLLDALAPYSAAMIASQKIQAGQMLDAEDWKEYHEQKRASEEFVKKDLYDEREVAKAIITKPIERGTGIDVESMSVFDEKSDQLAQSAGQMGATMLLSATGVMPWWAVTGMTTLGSEVESGLNQGATMEEAQLSGLISAAGEILTEKISGGIKFGGKALDDVVTKEISTAISNKFLRILAKGGVDVLGEAGEEILSEGIGRLGQWLTYQDEKTLKEMLASEEAMESYITAAIGGGVLGGVSNVTTSAISAARGVDPTTGLSKNEETVVEKVVNDTIAEKEADGKKLSNKEKTDIRKQVMDDLEKGRISTDTIESVIGGESYNNLKSITDNESKLMEEHKALKEEYDKLNKMKNGERTGEQDDRRTELKDKLTEIRSQIKEIKTVTKTQARSNLDTYMLQTVEGTKLAESYNEKYRRRQQFEADLSQYDSKQRAVIQKAIDSGILNNTNKTHEFVDWLARVSAEKGVSFDFVNNQRLKESGFAIEGKTINGFRQGNNITVNMQSRNELRTVVGHEITHVLEGSPELYNALAGDIKTFAEMKGVYKTMYDTAFENYKNIYKDMSEEDYAKAIEKEVTADLVGEYIFGDEAFVRRLHANNRNLFEKVYDEIKYFLKTVTAGSDAEKQLLKVKKTFEEVYSGAVVETGDISDADVQMSISTEYDSLPKPKPSLDPTSAQLQKDARSVREVRNETMLKNDYTVDEVTQTDKFFNEMGEFMKKAGMTYKYIGLEDVNNAKLKITYDNNGNPQKIVLSAMVQNGDYPVNFDFTSICKKRQSISLVVKELAKRQSDGKRTLDVVNMSPESLWKINEALRKEGLETACLGCFVESKRYNIQNFSTKATSMWNRIVNEVRKEQGIEGNVEYFNFAEGADLDSVDYAEVDRIFKDYATQPGRTSPENRMRALIRTGGTMYQKYLQPSDLMTPEGIEAIKSMSSKKNNFYGILQGVYGQAAPKEVMGFSPYNSEIALLPEKKGKQVMSEYIKSIGGVRMQSFSDFLVANVYDYMQMVGDLAARKLPAHAYTKEIAFAKIFGMTGIKVNMSVMFDIDSNLPNEYAGLTFVEDVNGDEEYNGVRGRFEYLVADQKRSDAEYERTGNRPYVQSIPFDEAVALQRDPRYSKNVGIIGVGYSDAHILKMLGDDDIRYVIPYHASSLLAIIKDASKIRKATDYTDSQSIRKLASIVDGDGNPVNFNEFRKQFGTTAEAYGRLSELVKNEGWQVQYGGKAKSKFNLYKDIEKTNDPRRTVENYLEYCAKNNFMPVFDQFAGHDNYYKLIYDFDPYDSVTGEYSPQTAVSNVYDGYNASEGEFSTESIQDLIDGEMLIQNEKNRVRNEKIPSVVDSVLDQLGMKDSPQFSVSDSEGNQLTEEQQEHFKDSKMRDENGYLMVMYHGTGEGGFHTFNPLYSHKEDGFFFTDSNTVAKSYSGTHETYSAKTLKTVDDLNRFFAEINATDYEAREEYGSFVLYEDGEEIAASDTADGLYEEYRDWTGDGYGNANYKVYLNLKNPLVVDAQGEYWDELDKISTANKKVYDTLRAKTLPNGQISYSYDDSDGKYNLKSVNGEVSGREFLETFGMKFFEEVVDNDGEFTVREKLVIDVDTGKEIPSTTHDYAVYAKEHGYDGVIFKNMIDNGVYASGVERFNTSTVAIAFDSNQIKSVANANPTSDPDIRYSISDKNQNTAHSSRGIYGKDIMLDDSTVDDAMPVSEMETTSDAIVEEMPVRADYAPLTEEEASLRDDRQIDEHYFPDEMPAEVDEGYNGDYAPHVKPVDHFYEKDIFEVGRDRSQKAYMYEHPEVKPFFQAEANYMLGELNNSTKGEKFYNDQLYYDTNGEMGWFGTTRYTSEDIAYLLDTFNYTYKDIEKGLKAIIEDNGKENNAISKRIEFLIDERLRTGYNEFMFGDKIPPNQEYINLLNSQDITQYSDESWNNWLRNLSDEDIQTLSQTREDVVPPAEYMSAEPDVAPVKDDVILYESRTRRGVTEGQMSMFEEPETPERVTRSGLHSNIINNVKITFESEGFNFDDVLKKAKNLSTFATVDNTPQRVMEKALGYKQGQVLSDLTVNKVAQNESAGTKWLDSFTNRKSGLLAQISKQYNIKPGSKESAAAQMYAEGFYVNEENELIKYGDAELAKDFPNRKVQENIKALSNDARIRQIYDETLKSINESRTRNAYPEIPRLDNYFLHFRAMDDTFSRLGLPFNPNDIRAKDLPTDLNGVTADLKPGQPYFASQMHRTGKRTSFDLLGGLERYLTSAKNQIYHIDDIQTLRALRNYIADTYGQANGLGNLDALSEEEAQERIEQVYGSHLSTFAKFLNEEANILAGKTALIDRGLEGIIGRRGITFLNTVNKQVGSNMVGFNISSSLTNVLPVVQTFAKTNKADFVKAFSQTVANKVGSLYGKNDGFAEQSPVMIRRKGADRFYRTPFEKVGDTGYVLMGAIDDFTTEIIARTKHNELTRKGMDSQKAHYETDKWVSRLMGDRSLGQMPQLYNSKMLGLITKFQLEVRNQLDSQFYDTIQEAKVSSEHIQNGLARNVKTAAKVASVFAQLAVGQHLFGKAFESIAGYNPAFDIIEVLLKTIGYDDDEESEDTVLDNVEQGFLMLLEDLPYTSTLTGGRIPISSALPIEEIVTGKDEYGNDKPRLETLGEIAPYYLLPTGYGQIKKSVNGLKMFDDDLPVSGSYTDSGKLRFPVEDTPLNRIQAGIFGQYANSNAREYFNKERSPLNDKQIQEYIDADMPISDYWEYRDGLKGLSNLSDKADYINSLDLPVSKKNILVNNQTDRKEKIDLTGFDDDYENFEEFDFAVNNPDKYEIALQVGGYKAYQKYQKGMKDMKIAEKVDYVANLKNLTTEQKNALINGETDRKEPIDLTGYENYGSYEEFELAKESPKRYYTSKVVGYDDYMEHMEVLNDIRGDKDSNGKTISGSSKRKKTEYINSLDLDYGQKIVLYRSLFDSKADKAEYNADIVEYLNSRDDISYEEMVEILESLDMKVHSDGSVTW